MSDSVRPPRWQPTRLPHPWDSPGKTKTVKRDKDGHYIMIKGSIQEEDITIINIYAPNVGAPQYVRQMLISMKGEINNNTIRVGDFNTPLTPMDRILLFLKLSLTVVGYSSFNCFKKIINLTN